MGNCCGPTAEQKAAAAADDEAQRKEARAKAAAAAEARQSASATKGAPNAGKAKYASQSWLCPPPSRPSGLLLLRLCLHLRFLLALYTSCSSRSRVAQRDDDRASLLLTSGRGLYRAAQVGVQTGR